MKSQKAKHVYHYCGDERGGGGCHRCVHRRNRDAFINVELSDLGHMATLMKLGPQMRL